MKISTFLIIIITAFLAVSCQQTQELFLENGTDWNSYGDAKWEFNNHELVGIVNNGSGFLMTETPYKNFSLKLEFKPDSTINSGVFIRCKNQEISPVDCYEVNIWDLHPNQDYRTGAIVMKSIPLVKVETNNRWNSLQIKAENDHIEVWINNVLTSELFDTTLIEGFIGLQATGTGEIRFRKIKIKVLE